jgi:hypothetical protein
MVVGSLKKNEKKLEQTCKNTRKKMVSWLHFPISGIFLLYILMFVNKLIDVSLPQRSKCVCKGFFFVRGMGFESPSPHTHFYSLFFAYLFLLFFITSKTHNLMIPKPFWATLFAMCSKFCLFYYSEKKFQNLFIFHILILV